MSDNPQVVVVTRHPALVKYLREMGIVSESVPVIEHASEDDVRGKVVVGVLPLRLAVLATQVWELPMDIPAELRGQELTLEQVREFAGEIARYSVRYVDDGGFCPNCGATIPF